MSQVYLKRDILDAYCRSWALDGPAADTVASSLQAALNVGALLGHKPDGAGKTAPLRYSTEEAAFAYVVLHLKTFGLGHEVAKGLRPGFFDWRLPAALDLIRKGTPFNLTIRFGHVAGRLGPLQAYHWCALHPSHVDPDWSPYRPSTRPGPAVEAETMRTVWPITAELRTFLHNLERDD